MVCEGHKDGERDRKNKRKTGFVVSFLPSDFNAVDGCDRVSKGDCGVAVVVEQLSHATRLVLEGESIYGT